MDHAVMQSHDQTLTDQLVKDISHILLCMASTAVKGLQCHIMFSNHRDIIMCLL